MAVEDANLKQKENNATPRQTRIDFVASWMARLGAAYRQEVTLETQAMYLQALADLPLDQLERAIQRAIRECRYFPTIAEIRALESQIEVSPERMEAAHARLRQRLAAQLDAPPPIAGLTDERVSS
jgi:hypothetical protein